MQKNNNIQKSEKNAKLQVYLKNFYQGKNQIEDKLTQKVT